MVAAMKRPATPTTGNNKDDHDNHPHGHKNFIKKIAAPKLATTNKSIVVTMPPVDTKVSVKNIGVPS